MRCPKCGKVVEPAGQVESFGTRPEMCGSAVVYQCEECLVKRKVGGMTFETALTFYADEQGRAVDPDTLKPVDGAYARSVN
jgi:hypothetical protein